MTGEDGRRYNDGQRVQTAHVHPVRQSLWLAYLLFSPCGPSVSSETRQTCPRTPPPVQGQVEIPARRRVHSHGLRALGSLRARAETLYLTNGMQIAVTKETKIFKRIVERGTTTAASVKPGLI